jgi:hypothetical protein
VRAYYVPLAIGWIGSCVNLLIGWLGSCVLLYDLKVRYHMNYMHIQIIFTLIAIQVSITLYGILVIIPELMLALRLSPIAISASPLCGFYN